MCAASDNPDIRGHPAALAMLSSGVQRENCSLDNLDNLDNLFSIYRVLKERGKKQCLLVAARVSA